jgi:Tfp pilus assembly protein FimT
MSNILVNTIKDTGNNTLLSSDGSGSVTASSSLASSVQSVGGLQNTPIFQVYKSADQSIPNATFTTVTFDTEQYDTGSAFASNTFTAPETGYYYIYSQLVWSGSTNSNYSLNRLMKNGNPVNWNAFFQTEDSGGYGGRIIYLSSSDTVTVQCYQDSGGSLSLRGSGEDECQFGGYKLIGA